MKQGWTYKTLRDIADIKGGKRVPKGYKLQTTETNHPYIRVADFNDFGTIDMSNVQYISDYIFEQIKNYTITDKDLYVSIAGTIGKTGIIPSVLNGANLTENACKLVFKEDINLRFVYLFTLSEIFKKQVEKATKQASQPKLALTRLAEIKISIPPLSEQERIVERLDAVFAQIDELKSNAERQLAEARALFQSALTQAMQPKPGWQEKKFGDVCFYHKEQAIHRDSKFIGMEHIESGTGILLGYQDSNEIESASFGFTKGDVLYGRLRPYLKKVIIAEFDGCCSTEIFPIRSKDVEPEFIKYWFLSDNITNKINATSAGCRMPRGNMNEVKHFPFAFPKEKSEQKKITKNFDLISNYIIELEEINRKTAAECDALKQALLRQIFE